MPFRFAPRHTLELKCALSFAFIFYLLFATMFLKLEVHYRARWGELQTSASRSD